MQRLRSRRSLRERVPDGDFRVGEMEDLPHVDDSFDAVIGLNAFQYAASPLNALREARRVARTESPIVIATWGRAADSYRLENVFRYQVATP